MGPSEVTPTTTDAKRRRATNRAMGGRFARSASPPVVHVAATARPRTAQEARQFDAAFDLLLAELVRQELGRARGTPL